MEPQSKVKVRLYNCNRNLYSWKWAEMFLAYSFVSATDSFEDYVFKKSVRLRRVLISIMLCLSCFIFSIRSIILSKSN